MSTETPSSPPPVAPAVATSAKAHSRMPLVIVFTSLLLIVGWFGYSKLTAAPPPAAPEPATVSFDNRPWDGVVRFTPAELDAIGIRTTPATTQLHAIRLPIVGTTKYDEETLSRVRLMFEARIDKVHVHRGERIKKGQPLLDVYSKELAEAKINYEIQQIEWSYAKNLLTSREKLLNSSSIPDRVYLETQNEEMKQRREMEVAKDRLLIYELSEADVDKVEHEVGAQKARMTIRSPADGIVIERNVNQGNLYGPEDLLFVIAPLDHLWVWGNVFESDLGLVQLGQTWEIEFPFLSEKVRGKLDYISNRVEPDTHAVRVRTAIPNVDVRLKGDMLVQGVIEIPPSQDRTEIPRSALIVNDSQLYVFACDDQVVGGFRRQNVRVSQERDDYVIISSGAKPGDCLVSVGALLVEQRYETLAARHVGR
ncbi:MAG: efflux RND transporter periplasmic adaptor subunit [Planctomycetaceae bacterium]|nr:efflux RND transporter periplasmic adaptor subunit [Planctomycetaceae bacterium]